MKGSRVRAGSPIPRHLPTIFLISYAHTLPSYQQVPEPATTCNDLKTSHSATSLFTCINYKTPAWSRSLVCNVSQPVCTHSTPTLYTKVPLIFRHRHTHNPTSKNSQKPGDELYAAFKQNFPHVGPGTISPTSSTASTGNTVSLTSTSIDQSMDQRCARQFHSLHQTFD